MLGIALYSGLAFGLGLLVPLRAGEDSPPIGTRFAIGAALLLIAIHLCAVVLALSLRHSVALIAVVAAAGWLRAAYGFDRGKLLPAITHPGLVLILLGAAAVLAHGGVGYVPYLIDEFTNWIGVSRIIHWAGSYEAVRETIFLPGYTPGWRLLLLLPWQVTGVIEPGASAAAPLVLHVAALALVYDLVVLVSRREARLPPAAARLAGWLFLLVLLAAEAMGRLWTYEMLIEQPQIYLLAIAMLLLLRAELLPQAGLAAYLHAGLALAAGFLLKNAIAAAAPGAALVALLPLAKRHQPAGSRIRASLGIGLALLAPLLVTVISWNAIAPPDGCLASPLAALSGGIPAGHDPFDLARRFAGAVATYVAAYKLPVTIVALAGLALGARAGLLGSGLLWLGFCGAYFLALYAYHLTCFGDFYYHALNSIPRFTRVPLQVLHVIGLVVLVAAVLRLASRTAWMARLPDLLSSRVLLTVALAMLIPLGAWQARQTYRTVTDLTTRAYQNADPRIAEMRNAAEYVRRHVGRDLPPRPTLAILGQGQDSDVRGYATYFARQGAAPLFDIHPRSSWTTGDPGNWQVKTSPAELIRELAAVDVLWPIKLDDWLTSEVLAALVVEPGCLARLPDVVLVREQATAPVKFRCQPKAS